MSHRTGPPNHYHQGQSSGMQSGSMPPQQQQQHYDAYGMPPQHNQK